MKKKNYYFQSLKKDFVIQTFKSGGKGGQHQSKTDSGVRIIHPESGDVGESRSDRSQHKNKKLALQFLTSSNKFKIWMNRKALETISKETIEQKIEKQMIDENIKIEIKDDNDKWIETKTIEENK